LRKQHPLLLANITELANALNNQPITGPVIHYNDVSIRPTFTSKAWTMFFKFYFTHT